MSQHNLLGTFIYADFSTILCISVLVELSEINGKHWIFPKFPPYVHCLEKTVHSQTICYLNDSALVSIAHE